MSRIQIVSRLPFLPGAAHQIAKFGKWTVCKVKTTIRPGSIDKNNVQKADKAKGKADIRCQKAYKKNARAADRR